MVQIKSVVIGLIAATLAYIIMIWIVPFMVFLMIFACVAIVVYVILQEIATYQRHDRDDDDW